MLHDHSLHFLLFVQHFIYYKFFQLEHVNKYLDIIYHILSKFNFEYTSGPSVIRSSIGLGSSYSLNALVSEVLLHVWYTYAYILSLSDDPMSSSSTSSVYLTIH